MNHAITISPAGGGRYRAEYRNRDLGTFENPAVEVAKALLGAGAKRSDMLAIVGNGFDCAHFVPMPLGVLAEPRTPPPIRRWRGARELENDGLADSQSLWHERSAIQ